MSTRETTAASGPLSSRVGNERLGSLLVFLSALMFSFGGAFARALSDNADWTVIFWRSVWAAAFLVAFMLWRDGWQGMLRLFRNMGLPGLVVALCFATASTSFVVALAYTTVANILLMMAGVPLIAALIAWVAFREPVGWSTWAAIGAVILGVAIMVSDSLNGDVSSIGDGLALLIAIVIAVATVTTRRYAHVKMTPATCLGTVFAAIFAASQGPAFGVTTGDMGLLFAFGVVNLGLGLAFFSGGARMIPAALAALLGTFEPILGPIWVWLIHGEVPSQRTIVGGLIVFAALLFHIGREFMRQPRPAKPGSTGIPSPH